MVSFIKMKIVFFFAQNEPFSPFTQSPAYIGRLLFGKALGTKKEQFSHRKYLGNQFDVGKLFYAPLNLHKNWDGALNKTFYSKIAYSKSLKD